MTKIIDLQNQCGEPVNNIESINVSQNEFSESINLSQLLLMKASQCIFESKPLQLIILKAIKRISINQD